jgi:hypothetical protein
MKQRTYVLRRPTSCLAVSRFPSQYGGVGGDLTAMDAAPKTGVVQLFVLKAHINILGQMGWGGRRSNTYQLP